MIDVSRLESGRMPVRKVASNLNQIAQAVINTLLPGVRNRQLTLSAPEPIRMECDPDLVRRILENLVNNALKFTPPGGLVDVSLSSLDGIARVSVRDTGCGIPFEHHQKIFEEFDQVQSGGQQRGTGLGLTFCKLAVTAHGGKIGVDSESGTGSTFWFTLPIEQTDVAPGQTKGVEVASASYSTP